jgi:hypothetical protein
MDNFHRSPTRLLIAPAVSAQAAIPGRQRLALAPPAHKIEASDMGEVPAESG